MNKTKFIVRVAMCVAMLIGGQFALNSVTGVEIVTVMMLCFCYCYGIRCGIAIATTFSPRLIDSRMSKICEISKIAPKGQLFMHFPQ